jgi:hypothetical protein
MKIIALTSANEEAMASVAAQVLQLATDRRLPIAVMVGVNTAHDAQAVFCGRGQLWRIGEDSTHPELDALIDCQISDAAPLLMARQVDEAVRRCTAPRIWMDPAAIRAQRASASTQALA